MLKAPDEIRGQKGVLFAGRSRVHALQRFKSVAMENSAQRHQKFKELIQFAKNKQNSAWRNEVKRIFVDDIDTNFENLEEKLAKLQKENDELKKTHLEELAKKDQEIQNKDLHIKKMN